MSKHYDDENKSSSSAWSSEDSEEDNDTLPPVLLRRQRGASEYASPPPSNRKLEKKKKKTSLSILKTPQPKTYIPIRDSPNNPFLDSPPTPATDDLVNSSDGGEEATDSETNGDIGENPTITYAHRGVRSCVP